MAESSRNPYLNKNSIPEQTHNIHTRTQNVARKLHNILYVSKLHCKMIDFLSTVCQTFLEKLPKENMKDLQSTNRKTQK